MKKLIRYSIILPLLTLPLIAAATAPADFIPAAEWHNKTLGQAMLNSVIFGALGIALAIIGFKVFDKCITKIDLEAEINKGNLAAAILSGAVIIGLCWIIAAAIS